MRIYLNHAGTSWPKPARVRKAVMAAMEPDAEVRWGDDFDVQHARVAACFAAAPERLLLTPGCTSALSMALADYAWVSGDALLVDPFAHQALHGPAQRLSRCGVQVEPIPLKDGALDMATLRSRLNQTPRVAMMAISMAANVTGAVLPYDELIARARHHGARVLLDAAQTVGWLSLDLPALGADMVAFGGHKGLLGPWGIGGLYVGEGVPMRPPRAGDAPPRPTYCDGGSVDRPALAGLAAAVSTPVHDLARARAQVAELQRVVEARGGTVFGPRDAHARMPTLAFRTRHSVAQTVRRLRDDGLLVSGGQQCAPLAHASLGTLPDGVVRLSVGPATTDEMVHAASARLSDLLAG